MVNVTYQRPSGSRDTIAMAASSAVTSTPGQVHVNRSGAVILASRSSPSRMANALRVKCADWRERRDLNRG